MLFVDTFEYAMRPVLCQPSFPLPPAYLPAKQLSHSVARRRTRDECTKYVTAKFTVGFQLVSSKNIIPAVYNKIIYIIASFREQISWFIINVVVAMCFIFKHLSTKKTKRKIPLKVGKKQYKYLATICTYRHTHIHTHIRVCIWFVDC